VDARDKRGHEAAQRVCPLIAFNAPTQRIHAQGGLRGEADRGVRGAESRVGAPLHQLKKNPPSKLLV